MGSSVVPATAAGKTRYLTTLTSGTSWTVPAGVTYVNVTLRGGGGAGGVGTAGSYTSRERGAGGQVVSSTLATTPAASITYAIGAGGTAGTSGGGNGGTGGTTTFTGATSATGGAGAGYVITGGAGTNYLSAENGGESAASGSGTSNAGVAGGSGSIDVEYWV